MQEIIKNKKGEKVIVAVFRFWDRFNARGFKKRALDQYQGNSRKQ